MKGKEDADPSDWALSDPVKTWPCPSCDRTFTEEDYLAMRYASHVAGHFNHPNSLVFTPSPSPSSAPLMPTGAWPDVIGSPHLPPPPPYEPPVAYVHDHHHPKVKHYGHSFTSSPSPSSVGLLGVGVGARRPESERRTPGYNCDHCHRVFVSREDYLAHLEYLLANPVVRDGGRTSASEEKFPEKGLKRSCARNEEVKT
jgi:hypothetical protein